MKLMTLSFLILATYLPTQAFEVGGSNFVLYRLDAPLTDPDHPTPGFKDLLTRFHEEPSLVKWQMQQMCNQGQRKIALMLRVQHVSYNDHNWLADRLNHSYSWYTDGWGGVLNPQIESNISNLVNLVSSLKKSQWTILF